MQELAYQTYLGLKNYFGLQNPRPFVFSTTLLPHRWTETLERGAGVSRSVLALQAAFRREGVYPPPGKTIQDCPVNGLFGPCTERATLLFQEKYRKDVFKNDVVSQPTGIVGRATIEVLNRLYGS